MKIMLKSIDDDKVVTTDMLFMNECAKEDEFKAIADDMSFIDNFTDEISTQDDDDTITEEY